MDLKAKCDNRAEGVVVSTLVYHPDYLGYCTNLKADHFYLMENKLFFWAIKELFEKHHVTEITAVNLDMAFEQNQSCKSQLKKYNIKNFQEYIDLAINAKVDDVQSFKMYVKRILDLSIARDVVKNHEETINYILAHDDVTVESLNQKLYKGIQAITTKYITDGDIHTVGDTCRTTWAEIERRKAAGEMNGIPSFLPSLKKFFLFQKKEMVLVSARMKVGKSVFGMLEALHAAQNGIPTLVFDSEMSDKLYNLRVISHYTGIPGLRLENELLTGDENAAVQEAIKKISKLPLWHIFNPSMSLDQFYSTCYQFKIQENLQFVVYDYIKGDDELESSRRSNLMGAKADFLKNRIAGELDLAVLAFAQIGRSGEVAESDALERYCSVSCELAKKTPEQIIDDGADCGTMLIKVKLNRLGPSMYNDYIDLEYAPQGLTLQEAKRHETQDDSL